MALKKLKSDSVPLLKQCMIEYVTMFDFSIVFFLLSIDIQCPDIPDPINGQIIFSGDADRISPFDYGTVAEYSCDDGLTLLNPVTGAFFTDGLPVERVCESIALSATGVWTGVNYVCQPLRKLIK